MRLTADLKSLKAVGKPGSSERLAQVIEAVDRARVACNNRNFVDLVPVPHRFQQGPASVEAFEWMLHNVQEGSSYERTANGSQKNAVKVLDSREAELERLKGSLLRTEEAGRRKGAKDTKSLAVNDLAKSLTGEGLLRIFCQHCGKDFAVKNRKHVKGKFAHACPNARAEDSFVAELKASIANLQKEVDENGQRPGMTEPSSPSSPAPQQSYSLKPSKSSTTQQAPKVERYGRFKVEDLATAVLQMPQDPESRRVDEGVLPT